jgi:hypothetical protein
VEWSVLPPATWWRTRSGSGRLVGEARWPPRSRRREPEAHLSAARLAPGSAPIADQSHSSIVAESALRRDADDVFEGASISAAVVSPKFHS